MTDMITVDTDTLDGWQLDWLVSQIDGFDCTIAISSATGEPFVRLRTFDADDEYSPTINWAHGGPTIERYPWALPFKVYGNMQHLGAYAAKTPSHLVHYGPTPLIAAMRAIVAASYGLKVQVPAIAATGEKP